MSIKINSIILSLNKKNKKFFTALKNQKYIIECKIKFLTQPNHVLLLQSYQQQVFPFIIEKKKV